MNDIDRTRIREQLTDAVYAMFKAGYDEESVKEEIDMIAGDYIADYGEIEMGLKQ